MKKTSILALALLSAAMISGARQVYAAASTIDGVVSDTKCGKKHMLPGKTDAQCIHACLKGKASYALVVGANVYTLAGKPRTIAPFACKHVKVEGSIQGLTLTVISIHEMRQDMPHDTSM
jgi:hypothetical protein